MYECQRTVMKVDMTQTEKYRLVSGKRHKDRHTLKDHPRIKQETTFYTHTIFVESESRAQSDQDSENL